MTNLWRGEPPDPTHSSRAGRHAAAEVSWVNALLTFEGQWGVLGDDFPSEPAARRLADRVRHSRGAWHGYDWQVKVRKMDDHAWRVFVRQVQDDDCSDTG